ncbi:hypothetical protein ACFU7T_14440 [Streptomyces sp. NPDC057555]|uniref:hypothetical protein n=1 Tax=Streptomyces sp. NPDC057555 TaxID=3346166 RepID=UPI00369B7C0B
MADETAAMQELWPQVLEATKKRRRFTWILLCQAARVLSYDGATLKLACRNQGSADALVHGGSISVLEEALEEVLDHPVAVEQAVEKEPPAPTLPKLGSPTAPEHAPAAALVSPQADDSVKNVLHRVLGQTAFLLHEQGNNQTATLLTHVEHVELAPGNRSEAQADAILIVPPSHMPRFTDTALAAIHPALTHVAGRNGLQINAVRAAPALTEIGDDWRQVLQARLNAGAASEQTHRTHAKDTSPTPSREDFVKAQTPGCTRNGKTTGRRCRRPAAEWPAYDDLLAPVAACPGHLTPEEWEACQQARKRSWEENSAARKAELAALEARGGVAVPSAKATYTPQPCTGECTSQASVTGSDSDGASMSCANCDSWVCVGCGQAQVENVLEFCADCSERESTYDHELEWDWQQDSEADTDPNPHAQLTAMVNDLVKATGTTHRQVNARLNRKIGVISRVGADEMVIRRAVNAARTWLDQLSPST